jgi:hypothetical protein
VWRTAYGDAEAADGAARGCSSQGAMCGCLSNTSACTATLRFGSCFGGSASASVLFAAALRNRHAPGGAQRCRPSTAPRGRRCRKSKTTTPTEHRCTAKRLRRLRLPRGPLRSIPRLRRADLPRALRRRTDAALSAESTPQPRSRPPRLRKSRTPRPTQLRGCRASLSPLRSPPSPQIDKETKFN